MFVMISKYLAKDGEEDAIIALHEDWQRHQQSKVQGYISGELLRNIQDSREFLAMMRFESYEYAQACANSTEYRSWFRRLVSLSDNIPVLIEYSNEWKSQNTE